MQWFWKYSQINEARNTEIVGINIFMIQLQKPSYITEKFMYTTFLLEFNYHNNQEHNSRRGTVKI